jgi:hypothetical protein
MAVPGMAKAHTTPEPPTDIDVLNYALTLEHLEYAFYRDGLAKFGEGSSRTPRSSTARAATCAAASTRTSCASATTSTPTSRPYGP